MTILGAEGFSYLKNQLHCEGVSLERIGEEVGTPAYVYSKAALVNRVRRLQAILSESAKGSPDCSIFFAVKACSNIHLLDLIGRMGCGADIVSGGELFRASVVNIPPGKVVFSGVGKSDKEIREALKAGIAMFNVESLPELMMIDAIAAELGCTPRASFRVNPNVDPKTHPYISTGLKKNKFGLSKDELRLVYKQIPFLKAVEPAGFSCHIGSQIMDGRPFVKAWQELRLIAEKAPFKATHLDLGGGLGIPYGPKERVLSLEDYGRLIRKTFKGAPYRISIEPGRALIGPSAVLLTRMVLKKQRGSRYFCVVDAAMNDLMRPALYGAVHPLHSVERVKGRRSVLADIVGPVCESADVFQSSARFHPLEKDALLAFGNAGAYGMTMSSQYNSRPRAAEVLVDGGTYKVIRSRETYADLISKELV